MTSSPPRSHFRLAGTLGAAIIMIIGVVGAGAAPAQAASSSTLCQGFTDCAREGRGNAGYAAVHRQSFWTMLAGHNCTNYVAYRLTTGRLSDRPPGTVDASTWGNAARKAGVPVTKKPRVGAVAWWKARKNGAGSLGHVAYVEAVRADGSILISEDNLGGTFKWRKLSKSSRGWPSGFIRFPRSSGSPSGKMLWARAGGAGQVRFSATAGESDVPDGQRTYQVSVGGPRGAAGTESFTFSTRFFRFERLKTLETRGRTSVYVYALNTPGTQGTDTLLGSRSVTIR
jgi:surface antigen